MRFVYRTACFMHRAPLTCFMYSYGAIFSDVNSYVQFIAYWCTHWDICIALLILHCTNLLHLVKHTHMRMFTRTCSWMHTCTQAHTHTHTHSICTLVVQWLEHYAEYFRVVIQIWIILVCIWAICSRCHLNKSGEILHVSARKVATLDSVPRKNVQSLNSRFEILCACALLYTAKTHTHTHTHTCTDRQTDIQTGYMLY